MHRGTSSVTPFMRTGSMKCFMSATETQPVTLKPYLPASAEGIKRFITQFPRLPYGISEFDSFVHHLASGNQCVLDLWQGNQRVAVAILLDQLETSPSSLEVALLAYRWDFSASLFMDTVLPIAQQRARDGQKNKIELISSLGLKVAPSDLTRKGFTTGPTTITYETSPLNPQLLVPQPPQWTWREATPETVAACYEILKINFPQPGAQNLVPFEKFEHLALQLPIKPHLLYEEEHPIAFVWVASEHQTGQLLFIARHPQYRSKGLGKVCLSEAVRLLKPFGIKRLQAEVKDSDISAIKLFEASGFRTIRKLTRFILPL